MADEHRSDETPQRPEWEEVYETVPEWAAAVAELISVYRSGTDQMDGRQVDFGGIYESSIPRKTLGLMVGLFQDLFEFDRETRGAWIGSDGREWVASRRAYEVLRTTVPFTEMEMRWLSARCNLIDNLDSFWAALDSPGGTELLDRWSEWIAEGRPTGQPLGSPPRPALADVAAKASEVLARTFRPSA